MKTALIFLLLTLTSSLSAETVRFYDKSGKPTGRADIKGNTTRYYDSYGRPDGNAYTNKANTRTVTTDRYGKPSGSMNGKFDPRKRN